MQGDAPLLGFSKIALNQLTHNKASSGFSKEQLNLVRRQVLGCVRREEFIGWQRLHTAPFVSDLHKSRRLKSRDQFSRFYSV